MKFVIFLFLLVACGSPPPPQQLRISFNNHPATLDPRKSGDFTSSTLICLIYEGLTRCDANGSFELTLAERVEVSADGKLYTFHLRSSLWTDETPVTAFDFENSWKAILDPTFPSLCAYLLYPIKNGEKARMGAVPLSEVGIKALNELTLQVELERPTPYFLSLTAFPLFLPFKEGSSNGPFRIERIVPNGEIALVKNEQFWNPKEVFLDQIQISIIPDEMTAFQLFERGELDWLGGPFSPIPPDALESLQKRGELHFIPMAATTFCTFNTETFPFQNETLRKAFSYAIDRGEIVDHVAGCGQLLATRPLPPSLFNGKNKALFPTFDPEMAREYYKKALEELGEIGPLTLFFKPGQTEKRLALALQKQWKEVLGVSVDLESIDVKTHMQKLQKREYQLSLASWIAQFHDPINILERFKSRKNVKNYPGWENQEFIHLLEEASEMSDELKRMELLERAEALFAEEMAIAPIYHWSNPSLMGKQLLEIATTPSGGILFERAHLKKL